MSDEGFINGDYLPSDSTPWNAVVRPEARVLSDYQLPPQDRATLI